MLRPYQSIELRHLRAFVAVAEDLGFRRAAERLHIAQPALSRAIMEMEAALRVRLFERSTRTVRLTPAAHFLLPEARLLFKRLDETLARVQRIDRGEAGILNVGFNEFTMSYMLPTIIMRFRSAYPNINVVLQSPPSPEMAELIRSGHLDLGFLTGAHLVGNLSSLTIRQERLVCLLAKSHPLSRHRKLHLSDIRNEPFVMGKRESWRSFTDVVDTFCATADFRLRVVQEAESTEGIIGLVAAGVGLSIYVERDWLRMRRDIVIRTFLEEHSPIATVVAWRPDERTKVLRNFIRVTQEVVNKAS